MLYIFALYNNIMCNMKLAYIEEKRFCTLLYNRKDILYDIANCVWIEGEVMQADELRQRVMRDITDKDNLNRVTQLLDLAYSEAVEMLYPYSKEAIDQPQVAHKTSDDDDVTYVIQLSLPYGFSATTIHLLDKLVREYLISRVVSDWMTMTNVEGSYKWTEKTQAIADKICKCKSSRRKPVRDMPYS